MLHGKHHSSRHIHRMMKHLRRGHPFKKAHLLTIKTEKKEEKKRKSRRVLYKGKGTRKDPIDLTKTIKKKKKKKKTT